MNKVYRVIWSRTKNCYVIVSEIARKNQRGSSKGRGVIAALAMTSVFFFQALVQQPTQLMIQ